MNYDTKSIEKVFFFNCLRKSAQKFQIPGGEGGLENAQIKADFFYLEYPSARDLGRQNVLHVVMHNCCKQQTISFIPKGLICRDV